MENCGKEQDRWTLGGHRYFELEIDWHTLRKPIISGTLRERKAGEVPTRQNWWTVGNSMKKITSLLE